MSFQKLALSAVAVAIVAFFLDYLFYGIIMGGTSEGMRETPLFGWLITSYFVFAFPFVHIYVRAYEGPTKISSGIKYGIIVSLLVFVFWNTQWMGLFDTMTMNDYFVDLVYKIVFGAIVGVVAAYSTSLPSEDSARGPGKATGGGATPPPPTGGAD